MPLLAEHVRDLLKRERCAANDAPSQTAAQSAHPLKQELALPFSFFIDGKTFQILFDGVKDEIVGNLIPCDSVDYALAPVPIGAPAWNRADEKKSAALHLPAGTVERTAFALPIKSNRYQLLVEIWKPSLFHRWV